METWEQSIWTNAWVMGGLYAFSFLLGLGAGWLWHSIRTDRSRRETIREVEQETLYDSISLMPSEWKTTVTAERQVRNGIEYRRMGVPERREEECRSTGTRSCAGCQR